MRAHLLRRNLVRLAVAGGTAAVALAGTVAPASAGTTPGGTFTIDPSAGPTGTVVSLTSQTDCFNSQVDPEPVVFFTDVADTTTEITPTLGSEGAWTATFEIPAGTPIGQGQFEARCQYFIGFPDSMGTVPPGFADLFTYTPVPFTVTAPATTTTTSTSTTTTTLATTTSTTAATTTTTTPAPTIVATKEVTDGQNIDVQTTGWKPGSTIAVTLESDPVSLGSMVADAAGNATGSFPLPAGFATGQHTLKLTGTGVAGQVQVLSAFVTVARQVTATTAPTTAAPTTAAVGTLPVTGGSPSGPLLVGGALLVTGATALALSRRRARA